ncbi:hypothetical protein L596_008345 [Steinernema carpocapsae]|uniref:Uncharacterized protein n=1 Tax=Steinernema carpocapsae TaxID=34508 RepID=A0A4U5PCB1_STECR|nr:hypothetical protein L596_008345 [Steinernema carpocapsae]
MVFSLFKAFFWRSILDYVIKIALKILLQDSKQNFSLEVTRTFPSFQKNLLRRPKELLYRPVSTHGSIISIRQIKFCDRSEQINDYLFTSGQFYNPEIYFGSWGHSPRLEHFTATFGNKENGERRGERNQEDGGAEEDPVERELVGEMHPWNLGEERKRRADPGEKRYLGQIMQMRRLNRRRRKAEASERNADSEISRFLPCEDDLKGVRGNFDFLI